MRKAILLCFGLLLSVGKIYAQIEKVDGSVYDTIFASIEHEGVRLRLVTTVYKDTFADDESIKVPVYPIVRNQKWPMGEVSNHTCAWVVSSAERPAVLLYG